jgi:hypothetical protein
MQFKSAAPILLLVATAAFLGGCDGTESGQPSPAPTTPSSAGQGAPKVTHPIANTSAVEANPCSVPPTSEVSTLGGGTVDKNHSSDSGHGLACSWTFAGGTGNISGGFITGPGTHGLQSLYDRQATGGLLKFEPQPPIQGYPAVRYDDGLDGKSGCAIAVGVRDDLAYVANAQLRDGNPALADPCTVTTKLATAVVTHLQAGN